MANNRMYLRCKACGETFFLGKRLGGGYYISQYEQYNGVPLMERLNKFYDDHEWCGESGLDCFELIYEEPPKPLTNADRIRAMTDDEIEEWYWWMHKEMMRYTDSFVFVHEWLKQDSETIVKGAE